MSSCGLHMASDVTVINIGGTPTLLFSSTLFEPSHLHLYSKGTYPFYLYLKPNMKIKPKFLKNGEGHKKVM